MASLNPAGMDPNTTTPTLLRSILNTLRDWFTNGIDFGSPGKFTTLEVTGALTLDTAVPVPANGQVGKGDAAWIVVGSGGNIPGTSIPVPAYSGTFVDGTVGIKHTQFRRLPSNLILTLWNFKGGNSGQAVLTFPSTYRPAVGPIDLTGVVDIIGSVAGTRISLATTGIATLLVLNANGDEVSGATLHLAEQ